MSQFNKVYIGKSRISGKGIFAKRDIKKNEIIFVVRGKIVKHSYEPNYQVGSRWLGIGKNTWVSPFRNNPLWFINHSCNLNAGLKDKKKIVAMKKIRKDEEITIDYSITEDDPYWKMRCGCGDKKCRKTIRSIRFLPKKLFKKYKPYILNFLQKSYISNNYGDGKKYKRCRELGLKRN